MSSRTGKSATSAAPKYYAVKAGKQIGVFSTWAECQQQITGYKGANYKSFPTRQEAADYVAGKITSSTTKSGGPPKFYGVAVGKVPGVYTSWDEAQAQIVGWKGPKYKKFESQAEAQAFVKSGGVISATATKRSSEDVDGKLEPPTKSRKRTATATPGSGEVLTIYTDGSSRGNGRKGASAGVGVFFGVNDPRNVSERLEGELQTNQRAELTAVLRAVEIPPLKKDLHIISDSNYSIKCVTQWYISWMKNGWTTSQGQPVLNRDLVEAIRARINAREKAGSKTEFSWVKGHAEDPGNVAADQLAVSGASKPLTK